MKKLILIMAAVVSFTPSTDTSLLTKKERRYAARYMENSMQQIFKEIKNMDETQWTFTPSDDGWSIAGACEHLLIAEKGFYSLVAEKIIGNEANRKAPEAPLTDEQVKNIISDRSPARRVKTAPPFEPTGALANPADFIAQYKAARKRLMDFVKNTDVELKDYYWDSPAGRISAYQWLILASAHSDRHFDQMKEVMAESDFPK